MVGISLKSRECEQWTAECTASKRDVGQCELGSNGMASTDPGLVMYSSLAASRWASQGARGHHPAYACQKRDSGGTSLRGRPALSARFSLGRSSVSAMLLIRCISCRAWWRTSQSCAGTPGWRYHAAASLQSQDTHTYWTHGRPSAASEQCRTAEMRYTSSWGWD